MRITFYDYENCPSVEWQDTVVDFLFEHLDKYGDPREDIRKALLYALRDSASAGGFVCTATENDKIVGAVIINRTGMESYIPENILVYIAVHRACRGEGIGRQIMTEVIRHVRGGIALHVEPDNPALILYQNLGFVNKYLEMRLSGKEEF